MAFLTLDSLRKSFGATPVVRGFSLAVERGEFVSFLGPSGCGKTTTLRMIAGFERPDAGTITVDGRDVTAATPNRRNVGMVFQSYALFPNMTVASNIAFGLKVAGKPAAEIAARVAEMLALIKLPHLADRYPYQLSGGQQQRVALARAIATRPSILLLDEPLSALDARIRVSLREDIRQLQRQLGITTVYVTHDQEEALSMSDRIVVMNEGQMEQVGTPFDIYNFPRTRFVASFVGTLNICEAKVIDATGGTLALGRQTIRTTQDMRAARNGDARSLAMRPEAFGIGPVADGANAVSGLVEEVTFLGSVVRSRVNVDGQTLSFDLFNNPATPPPAPGQSITLTIACADVLVLDAPA